MYYYDVLMVNPIIDGMNLVSKEGPLVNKRDGVLILSEMAGSYEQLSHYCINVSPTDLEGTVRALHEALTMPEERTAPPCRGAQDLDHRRGHRLLARAPVPRPHRSCPRIALTNSPSSHSTPSTPSTL